MLCLNSANNILQCQLSVKLWFCWSKIEQEHFKFKCMVSNVSQGNGLVPYSLVTEERVSYFSCSAKTFSICSLSFLSLSFSSLKRFTSDSCKLKDSRTVNSIYFLNNSWVNQRTLKWHFLIIQPSIWLALSAPTFFHSVREPWIQSTIISVAGQDNNSNPFQREVNKVITENKPLQNTVTP